jgi:two-component system, chemotaxis family, protein-glutamate methylesterase/glutaminase
MKQIHLIIIGTSAGGISALQTVFSHLDPKFSIPILVVLHIHRNARMDLSLLFKSHTPATLMEVTDKTELQKRTIYFAPPDYHVLIEHDHSLSLTQDEPVHFSRPSIDVTFESAAITFKNNICGVLLTGANSDGAYGLQCIHEMGGTTLVQTPEEAEISTMPNSAIDLFKPDAVLGLTEIAFHLNDLDEANI